MKFMKYVIVCLSFFIISCTLDLDLTVHDEDKAAEQTKQFFEQLRTHNGVTETYENSHIEFKNIVNQDQYSLTMKKMTKMINNHMITLSAYETYGSEEAIAIYAIAKKEENTKYFRIIFKGTKSKGYNVLNFNMNDQGFKASGFYKEFTNPVFFKI